MQLGALRQVPGRKPASGPLVPGPLRWPAVALLAVCVAVTAMLAVRFVGYGLPGWLDTTFDPRIQAHMARFPVLLNWLPSFGTLGPVAAMTLALALTCSAVRRWSGAVLAVAAVPIAVGLTEYMLKPSIGEAIGQGFPSGHATSMFALAAASAVLLAGAPRGRVPGGVRLLLALMALGLATFVAAAMVANGAHVFTDAVGGAAVGIAVVLACALTLDLVASWWRRGLGQAPPAG